MINIQNFITKIVLKVKMIKICFINEIKDIFTVTVN